MGNIMQKIPEQLKHPLDFLPEEIEWEEEDSFTFQANKLFVHEVGFFLGVSKLKPWEEPDKYIPFLRSEWEALKEELESLFKTRDSENILEPMKKMIGIYLEFLYWSNNMPVNFPLNLAALNLKPVNCHDRIQFILSRPTLYHSFIQLIELATEQEKLHSKALLLKQTKQTKDVQE